MIISISTHFHSVPVTIFFFIQATTLSTTPVLKAFPEAYAERGRVIEREDRHARLDTPIFVCQLSFPGLSTVLHFFEPRYAFSPSWMTPGDAA